MQGKGDGTGSIDYACGGHTERNKETEKEQGGMGYLIL